MKLNKKATSIVEAMVIMLIIVTWVTWMYKIYSESMNLSASVDNKIIAIQIANWWIESFTNIRDTNWQVFSSDYENCWNTLNYDSSCIWVSNSDHTIQNASYIINKNSDNRWVLTEKPSNTYWNWNYIDDFKVWLDSNWIYTQWTITQNIKPTFTREIKVSYPDSEKIKIVSLVQWVDDASTVPHKLEVEQILTNWKK